MTTPNKRKKQIGNLLLELQQKSNMTRVVVGLHVRWVALGAQEEYEEEK